MLVSEPEHRVNGTIGLAVKGAWMIGVVVPKRKDSGGLLRMTPKMIVLECETRSFA